MSSARGGVPDNELPIQDAFVGPHALLDERIEDGVTRLDAMVDALSAGKPLDDIAISVHLEPLAWHSRHVSIRVGMIGRAPSGSHEVGSTIKFRLQKEGLDLHCVEGLLRI